MNKSIFNIFSRILIKIGFYHFKRHPKSSFHPKFGPQKFFWSASWKIFVLEFLKDRFQKLLKSKKLWFLHNFHFAQVILGQNFYPQDVTEPYFSSALARQTVHYGPGRSSLDRPLWLQWPFTFAIIVHSHAIVHFYPFLRDKDNLRDKLRIVHILTSSSGD